MSFVFAFTNATVNNWLLLRYDSNRSCYFSESMSTKFRHLEKHPISLSAQGWYIILSWTHRNYGFCYNSFLTTISFEQNVFANIMIRHIYSGWWVLSSSDKYHVVGLSVLNQVCKTLFFGIPVDFPKLMFLWFFCLCLIFLHSPHVSLWNI